MTLQGSMRNRLRARVPSPAFGRGYQFNGGYPTLETVRTAFGDLDLVRAIQMYRIFYPTVSSAAMILGCARVGVEPNRIFGMLDVHSRHRGFTLSSDTPYGILILDLRDGPLLVEMPPGALIGVALDMNQRWIMDMGLPGPEAGGGGRHLFLPSDYHGAVPGAVQVGKAMSNHVIIWMRSLPMGGDVASALERLETIEVFPLRQTSNWVAPRWRDTSRYPQDLTPHAWESSIQYWRVLHEVVNNEPAFEGYRDYYGDLTSIGICKGRPFAPDARLKGILERAAALGSSQMRVEAFSDRRRERLVWRNRQWEWVGVRLESGSFDTPYYTDTYAREKWFFQAMGTSPSTLRGDAFAGILDWLCARDRSRAYLDGGKSYRLTVCLPVPAKLFWSVTVYDADSRSQIATEQGRAALRSAFELRGVTGEKVELYFGPTAPAGHQSRWIQTTPGRGWFSYFRIYGPEQGAFDGSWRLQDFEETT